MFEVERNSLKTFVPRVYVLKYILELEGRNILGYAIPLSSLHLLESNFSYDSLLFVHVHTPLVNTSVARTIYVIQDTKIFVAVSYLLCTLCHKIRSRVLLIMLNSDIII